MKSLLLAWCVCVPAFSRRLPPSGPNIAAGRPVTVSSLENGGQFPVVAAVDGDYATRWSSARTDSERICVDLGAVHNITRLKINWKAACGRGESIKKCGAVCCGLKS